MFPNSCSEKRRRRVRREVKQKVKALRAAPHQHVYVVDKVQEEHGQLHDEVGVVHVGSFVLPGPRVLQVPQVNGVPVGGGTAQAAAPRDEHKNRDRLLWATVATTRLTKRRLALYRYNHRASGLMFRSVCVCETKTPDRRSLIPICPPLHRGACMQVHVRRRRTS